MKMEDHADILKNINNERDKFFEDFFYKRSLVQEIDDFQKEKQVYPKQKEGNTRYQSPQTVKKIELGSSVNENFTKEKFTNRCEHFPATPSEEFFSPCKELLSTPCKEFLTPYKVLLSTPCKEFLTPYEEFLTPCKEFLTPCKEFLTPCKEFLTPCKEPFNSSRKEIFTTPCKQCFTTPTERFTSPREDFFESPCKELEITSSSEDCLNGAEYLNPSSASRVQEIESKCTFSGFSPLLEKFEPPENNDFKLETKAIDEEYPKKPDLRRLSDEQRWFIVIKRKQNLDCLKLSEEFEKAFNKKLVPSTINKVYKKYIETNTIMDKPRSGRPKKLTLKDVDKLNDFVSKNPFTTLREVSIRPEANPSRACMKTLKKELKQLGIKSYSISSKFQIRPNNAVLRLVFAREHLDWTVEQWGRMVFSDESQMFPSCTQMHKVYKRANQYVELPVEENLDMRSVKLWGYITSEGVGDLIRLDSNMNAELYKKTLRNSILKFKDQFEKGEKIFMQDNASAHLHFHVKSFFSQHKITPIIWPPQSPDLNPIENIWSMMKKFLWSNRKNIKNADDTWEMAKQFWNGITIELIKKLYESLPRRCKEVIRANGFKIRRNRRRRSQCNIVEDSRGGT